ncbi:MAG TPA: hypothetical protein VMS64_33490 [Candidatus Methylomirabilis sp.]|nr:hypothetical protein [Candidatus Methylomirabilis sp.]
MIASRRAPALILAAIALAVAPGAATGQVFLASVPHPQFSIGPLFVLATVTPEVGPVTVRISWSLTLPPHTRPEDVRQDLYILWPAEVAASTTTERADPQLRQYLNARGFEVVNEGRLTLLARDRSKLGTTAEGDPLPESASFVTFYKRGTSPAQTGLGTFIKIPWTPVLTDPITLASLTMKIKDLVTPKPATWFEGLFWGRRYILTLGAGTAGSVTLYSMYLEQRDRVIRLAPDFSLLIANFDDADHLRIEEISPATATRRPSRLRAGTENVSLPLIGAEGSVPQVLKIQFTYFSGRIAWRPILVSLVLLILGNLMGAFMFSQVVGRFVRRRLRLGRGEGRARERGRVLAADTLDQIVPGTSTRADVLAICGPPEEEHRRRASAAQHTLIYRGTRSVPYSRHRLGWLSTVSRWEEEQHEVEISFEGDRVRDVQTRVRRARG